MGESQWVRWSEKSGPRGGSMQDFGKAGFAAFPPHPRVRWSGLPFPGHVGLRRDGSWTEPLETGSILDGPRTIVADEMPDGSPNWMSNADDVAGSYRILGRGYTSKPDARRPLVPPPGPCWKKRPEQPDPRPRRDRVRRARARGTLTETAVRFAPNRNVQATFSRACRQGTSAPARTLTCNRSSNLPAGTGGARSPHVIPAAGSWMGTVPLTDLTVAGADDSWNSGRGQAF